MTVSVSHLKAHLSEILRAVQAGEEVVVTDRGRPVARLAPLVGADAWEAQVDTLVAAGAVRPGRGLLPPSFATRERPADRKGALLAALLEERAAGR
ncbi:MAG: type II toxin-antitoxin system prevent-host-death family antitoxin [Gemmatimonadota bacterium]|nr:type II toxin-antitoxin system prevent-host-death family antitoxin [Gemmatimonadota bacterium]